jgi:hypothetical protein
LIKTTTKEVKEIRRVDEYTCDVCKCVYEPSSGRAGTVQVEVSGTQHDSSGGEVECYDICGGCWPKVKKLMFTETSTEPRTYDF